MCKKGGRRFLPTFPSHTAHQDPTLLTNPKDTGDVFPSRTTKISKDAHNEAPRRMHTTKHLEGCEQKHLEGCTSYNIANVKLSHQNKHDYKDLRPDQHKYSATLHPGRTSMKASHLINTTALFTSCSMRIFTNKI